MNRLVLGLDIGITSVGYGVINIDTGEFVDYGVRLFKEGTAANNEERRTKRGTRRLIRRKATRLMDMKKYLYSVGLMDNDFIYLNNPYEIRKKGLTNSLTKNELVTAILHITKHRGTSLEASADESIDEQGTKSILSENNKSLKDKYICELQLERLNEEGKIRNIYNNFRTEDYVKELMQILNQQNIQEDIKRHIIEIVSRRRRYDQGPGSEKSPTPYGSYRLIDGNLIKVNLIDMMRGKCSVFPDELRAPSQSYSAELFNLLNDLNNLKIDGEKILPKDKLEVINYVNNKGNITFKQLLKILNVSEDDVSGFRIDKNNKPLLTEFKGYKKVLKVFKDHQSENLLSNLELVDIIMEINTKAKGIEERKQLMLKVIPNMDSSIINDLAHLKGISGYHSLSFKALRLLNDEMIKTDMNQMQLLHQLDLYDKNRVSLKGQKSIQPDNQAILSPVAKRAHRETFKVINALRKKYGEFDSIVIETTRDKNSQEQKKRISDIQKANEKSNNEVNQLLKDAGYDPNLINGKTKMKVRLYLEQEAKTAYTLQSINLKTLIEDSNAYEIDHIIPISISLDDSYSNKVLVTHDENQQKSNLTPIKAYMSGKFLNANIDTYKSFVKSNPQISRKKKSYLLFEEDITKFEVIQEFINRNLIDTSYACRSVMTTLKQYFKDNEIDTKIHTIKGQATSAFRKRIGLVKDRDEDYLHHAIDALIVASLKKLNLVNSYLMKIDFDKMYDEQTGEIFPVLPNDAYLDSKYISFVSTIKNIYEESSKYYNGLKQKEEMNYPIIKISHKIDTKPNRKISDETLYSTRTINGTEMLVERIKNIYDSNEKAAIALVNDILNEKYDKYIMYHKDPNTFNKIKEVILNHYQMYKGSKEYYTISKKGDISLVSKSPLELYYLEHGPITKYAKKNNGPGIKSMKFYSEVLGNHLNISSKYSVTNKKVIYKQVKPYRTDFYQSIEGKIKIITIRYKDVMYSSKKDAYVIDKDWYYEQKQIKGIDSDWHFLCSLHRDELIAIQKEEGKKKIYVSENSDANVYLENEVELLKFTATNNDVKGIIEVKPIYCYCKKQLMASVGAFIHIKKYSTDVLGNMYEVKNNVLKLEFR